jgi:glucose-6-phosphate 1-epimerase
MDPFSFAGEIDRIYWDANEPADWPPPPAAPRSPARASTTWWCGTPARSAPPPWPDMPDDDWLQMLCVEAAQIGRPVTLAPGQEWVARQGFEV